MPCTRVFFILSMTMHCKRDKSPSPVSSSPSLRSPQFAPPHTDLGKNSQAGCRPVQQQPYLTSRLGPPRGRLLYGYFFPTRDRQYGPVLLGSVSRSVRNRWTYSTYAPSIWTALFCQKLHFLVVSLYPPPLSIAAAAAAGAAAFPLLFSLSLVSLSGKLVTSSVRGSSKADPPTEETGQSQAQSRPTSEESGPLLSPHCSLDPEFGWRKARSKRKTARPGGSTTGWVGTGRPRIMYGLW